MANRKVKWARPSPIPSGRVGPGVRAEICDGKLHNVVRDAGGHVFDSVLYEDDHGCDRLREHVVATNLGYDLLLDAQIPDKK